MHALVKLFGEHLNACLRASYPPGWITKIKPVVSLPGTLKSTNQFTAFSPKHKTVICTLEDTGM